MTRCRHRWSPPSFFRVYSLSVSVCIPSRLAFSSWISSLVNRLREVECNFSLTSKSVARAAPSTHFLRFFFQFLQIPIIWRSCAIFQWAAVRGMILGTAFPSVTIQKFPARRELLPHTPDNVVAQLRIAASMALTLSQGNSAAWAYSEIHRYFWNGYIIWSEDLLLRGVCGHCKIDIFEYLSFYEEQLPSPLFLGRSAQHTDLPERFTSCFKKCFSCNCSSHIRPYVSATCGPLALSPPTAVKPIGRINFLFTCGKL